MIENDAPVIDGIDTTNNATIKKGYDFTFNVKDEQKDKNYSGIEQIKVTANDVPLHQMQELHLLLMETTKRLTE